MGKRLKRGFYWRGGIIWLRTDPVTGHPASTRCRDASAAELHRAERERLAASPAYAASLAASVGVWVNKTIDYKRAQRADGTVSMYTVKLGHVARIFGKDAPLASVTAGAVDHYIAQRSSEHAVNNTIARELTCLRQMLRLAKRAGQFAGDIAELMPVGFSAGYVPVTRTLKREDLPRLLAALRSDRERAWVKYALATAGDVGDVERARPEDYDPARGVVRVRGTKTTTRDAELPVLALLRPLLEEALPYLPLSWPRVSKALGEASERAGLGHLSPKDLRRSVATWLIEAGVPQPLVSRFLRHRNDLMVRTVYGQMQPSALGDLIDQQVQKRYSDSRPLGETGKRRGLKRPSRRTGLRDLAGFGGLDGRYPACSGAVERSKTLQRETLFCAAERMGVAWPT